MMVTELVARLESEIETLTGRCQTAAELAELSRQGAWPQASPAAFVIPLGLHAAGRGEASAGAFTQLVDEQFAVLLVVRTSGDITGGKAIPTIDALVWEIIDAVCGWGPEEAIGVFHLRRGQIISADKGRVTYQLDFGLQQQVRTLN